MQPANEFVVPCVGSSVQFLQMINKWAVVSEGSVVYLYDVEKFRQGNYIEEVRLEVGEMKIFKILEIISNNTVCLVAGSEVTFYNESMSQKKWKKFQHSCDITNFIYC